MIALKNNTSYIKRNLMASVVKLLEEDSLVDKIEEIPIKLFPRSEESIRCCIYKDRAIIRYRLMAILGVSIEEDEDELKPLRSYAEDSLNREKISGPALTMLNIACSSCSGGSYQTTEICKGCVARPCVVNCPKKCIEIREGRSYIDQDNCIKCGKCKEMCPYNAIVYSPLPCGDNCPVDAIKLDSTGIRYIDFNECIHCGSCVKHCPFGAIVDRSQLVDFMKQKKLKRKMSALVAPSLFGQFPGKKEQLIGAILSCGFHEVIEVAQGADIVAQEEVKELIEKIESKKGPLTNSCCPAWKEAVEKHIPGWSDYISHTKSPMVITGDLNRKEKETINVFIGPCLGKKKEAFSCDEIDIVLTFEELGALFLAFGIEIDEVKPSSFVKLKGVEPASQKGRIFAQAGGLTKALKSIYPNFKGERIEGLSVGEIKKFKKMDPEKTEFDFLEVMACEGGCLGGSFILAPTKQALRRIDQYFEE